MAANYYHFVTHWVLPADAGTLFDILADPLDLVRWWPAVYLDVRQLAAGDEHGVGSEFALYTKGWLPYTLRWNFRVTEVDRPSRLTLEARGDFSGTGIWTFREQADGAEAIYEWTVRADKALLRRLSFLLKPVFAANHRWAMARGEESLRLELRRRATADRHTDAASLRPPGPSFAWLARRKPASGPLP